MISIAEHAVAMLVALPLLFAFLIPLAEKLSRKLRLLISSFGVFLIAATILYVAFNVFSTGPAVYTIGVKPAITMPSGLAIPVRIIFEVDAFSAFMLLIVGLAMVVTFIYSLKFIEDAKAKYYSMFFLMVAGMLGLLSTGDLFNLFVFVEVLSLSSAGLVAFRHTDPKAIEAAYKYLIVSALASLMLLFAIGLLYGNYGLLNIAAIARVLRFSFVDIVAIALLVSAFAMKAGAVPMHLWVPDAYGRSPAPITAILVVASQTCLYALFRISFSLFGAFAMIQLVGLTIVVLGVLSMFVGVTMALIQKDIKRLMA